MKTSDVVSGIVVFFNDLIGAVIPGLVLLSGFYWLNAFPMSIKSSIESMESPFDWLLPIAFAFALGHGLIAIHRILELVLGKGFRGIRSLVLYRKWDTRPLYIKKVLDRPAYKQFRADMIDRHTKEFPDSDDSELRKMKFHDLRSIAMTISKEGGDLARRFMFISLFCYGIAMAVLVLGIYFLVNRYASHDIADLLAGVFITIIFMVFYYRGLVFNRRALGVPFSVAIAEFIMKSATNERDKSVENGKDK